MPEPLPISVVIAREIGARWMIPADAWDVTYRAGGVHRRTGLDVVDSVPTPLVELIDARIRPLVEALREARGYVADYACDKPDGHLLAQIDAALRAAGDPHGG